MSNIYDYRYYYKDYLDELGVSLDNHFDISPLEKKVELDYQRIINWSDENISRAMVKGYRPRPFIPPHSMKEAVIAQSLGYNDHNTTEINWGIEPEDDAELKYMLGSKVFLDLNLNINASMVRLLRYDPGQCLPLHTDSYSAFKKRFGDKKTTRYFVAVSPWDWGHFLQVHDNMIHHWEPGYAVEIPNDVFHLSGNCGILPKYSLTITGHVNE